MAGRNLFENHQPQEPVIGRNLFDGNQNAVISSQPMSTAEDVVRSSGSGLIGGTADLLGTPGTMSNLLNDLIGGGLHKGYELATGREPEKGSFFAGNAIPASIGSGEAIRQGIDVIAPGTTTYEPKTTEGQFAKTGATFVPGAAAFGGFSPSSIAKFGLLPGLASEGAGQLTSGTPYEPYARVAAALLAPLATAPKQTAAMISEGARKVVAPFRSAASPERQALIDVLKNEGVDITAGQTTGSKALRYKESQIGGSAAQNFAERQGEQFTSAIMKRIGSDATHATPEAVNQAGERIGGMFKDLAARNNLIPDQPFTAELGDTLRSYVANTNPSSRVPVIENTIADLAADAAKGPISGAKYQEVASTIGKKIAGASGEELEAYQGIRSALDDAMERSIAAANPDDLGVWKEARNAYRNLLVVEKAVTGAGENARQGLISPAQLRSAVVGQGRRAFARGQGDFADLARAGEGIMAPLPDSGTTSRWLAAGGGTGLGAAIGSALGGGIPGAVIGAGVGAGAPYVAGRTLMSKPVQSFLANQALSGSGRAVLPYASVVDALVNSAMRNQGSR